MDGRMEALRSAGVTSLKLFLSHMEQLLLAGLVVVVVIGHIRDGYSELTERLDMLEDGGLKMEGLKLREAMNQLDCKLPT